MCWKSALYPRIGPCGAPSVPQHSEERLYIQACEIGQLAKKGGLKPAGGQHRLFAAGVDMVGPLPETNRGNRWILVAVDHFTRWQDVIAIPDATTPSVTRVIDKRILCYSEIPKGICSDQGAQFESTAMAEPYDLCGLPHTHTTPYHPQAIGVVERGNRVLGDSLRPLLRNG